MAELQKYNRCQKGDVVPKKINIKGLTANLYFEEGDYAVNFWKSHSVLLWGELSILVYPVKSICYLTIIEYFNAIYICDCLSNVTPGPEDEQQCWRKTVGSSNNDYHLHDIWCFRLSYKHPFSLMPQGTSYFHIGLDSGSLNMLLLHWLWVIDQHQTLDLLNSDPGPQIWLCFQHE